MRANATTTTTVYPFTGVGPQAVLARTNDLPYFIFNRARHDTK